MSSDRILIVRIMGLGIIANGQPAAFTSRSGLSYLTFNEVAGVVAEMGSQLSSELTLFGALGSDPTTSFSLLATEQVSSLVMSRGKVAHRDINNASVTVTQYIKPAGPSGTSLVKVTDTTYITEGDMIRISTTVFYVEQVVDQYTLLVSRSWGSANIPIPMSLTGYGVFGATVYNVNTNRPNGGIESLPVVISTAPVDATARIEEEIIFRGIVNKVSVDKSSRGRNQFRVECGSMMSYVKSAKFTPARGATRALPDVNVASLNDTAGVRANIDFTYQIVHDERLYGTPYEYEEEAGNTRVPLLQIRNGAYGGMVVTDPSDPWTSGRYGNESVLLAQVATRYYIDRDNPDYMYSNAWLGMFRDGYYSPTGAGPSLDPTVTVEDIYTDADGNITDSDHGSYAGVRWSSQGSWFWNEEFQGETTFIGRDFAGVIVDLLLGTYDGYLSFANGCRAATEAAWLPFGVYAGVSEIQDIIDLGSLYSATSGLAAEFGAHELPFPQGDSGVRSFGTYGVILPYVHEDVRTIGDVLEELLKRTGVYMVYDKAKFRFGRWSARPSAPTRVSDTGLAEPKVSLSFDRQNCVQTALMKVCWRIDGDKVTTQEIPVNNIDLGLAGVGKIVELGQWLASSSIEYLPEMSIYANAIALTTRYSQAAAMVEVSYRDAAFDLVVGQQIAFSSAYVPNAYGTMGVSFANGFVLKAARAWQTPTTTYTIALPGYLSPNNRLAVYSCSGRVVSIFENSVNIAPNDFTLPPGEAQEGAPVSDAEAFDLSISISGGAIGITLLDQYGTPKGASANLDYVRVDLNRLTDIPSIASVAVPGDIIVLSDVYSQSNVNLLWDTFMANTDGTLNGGDSTPYTWVP